MKVGIVFDPRLGVDRNEFVSHWSANPESRAIGEMQLASAAPSGTFGDPTAAMVILTSVAAGLAVNAISASVKAIYAQLCAAKNERPKETEFQRISQADGTEITIVRLKE
jgi:hypothetical protein